jgi:predicted HTH domain antitoxin
MIQDGKLSLEEVSQYTDLSLQEIETLAATV